MPSEDLLLWFNTIPDLALFFKVLQQKRVDKNKVYSLHEPEVRDVSKGKEHKKKYEFGNKVSLIRTDAGVIIGAMSFCNMSMVI